MKCVTCGYQLAEIDLCSLCGYRSSAEIERQRLEQGDSTMLQWNVYLYGIQWDDGDGEYDVSALPKNLCVTVVEDTEEDAIERALDEATDEFDSLIEGTEQIRAMRSE